MIKLNRLLYATSETDVFVDRIAPTREQRDVLIEAKNAIRDHLRPRIRAATVAVLGMDKAVEPKFRTQGSWAYKTCIQPAWQPPQEMDWDFGVYLPITVWEEGGPPHAMAKLYFTLVEQLLLELCVAKGWKLYSGKETCIRVKIDSWAHVDIPLYAAPASEFASILEKSLSSRLTFDSARDVLAENSDLGEIAAQEWADLDHIVMATRSGEWKASDPEAVSKWFLDRVRESSEQLRRVCRYLKAWRDLHWLEGDGPTSVCLMVAVAQKFEPIRGRDDLALEAAAKILAVALSGDVRAFAIDKGAEDFNKRLDAEQRMLASSRASKLASRIQSARSKLLHASSEAITILQDQLGFRVPHRLDLVDVDGGEDAVRAVAAIQVARPVVKATNAG